MARYDNRGVIIPAPLQGGDAGLSAKRYGDKHRGPAVKAAYELWHCWIDLAERSEDWPCPGDLPPRMVEFAQVIPEAQRPDWVRRQANHEEVDRRISYAIRSGDLPIWVAPQGEPERLVATGALATIDRRSITCGVFCPLSEEYKSEGDRPWLWGRPLFVKCDDWTRFTALTDAEKKLAVAPDPMVPLLPPEGQLVTLSHALSWIAFGVSMDNDHLHEVLSQDLYGEHDPQESIAAALERLLASAASERIAITGKYRPSRDDDAAQLLTDKIAAMKFHDYRQFSYLEDELRHGKGLLFWHKNSGQVFHDLFGGGRKDSYLYVAVNRGDLLREFRPHGSIGWNPEAIQWSDLAPPELARAVELAGEAEADEWWNWPQAVAWVGSRNLEHVGTIRLCAEPWRDRHDHQYDVALGAERFLAQAYCAGAPAAEDDLQRAIERGEVTTLGRATFDSRPHELKPLDWRGGKIVFNRTATLVSAANLLSEWACDIAVNRADLWVAFPATERLPTLSGITVTSTARAETECREWLTNEFAADPERRRNKANFRTAAMAAFQGRLSARGFNNRVWPDLAQQFGRVRPGAKRKS